MKRQPKIREVNVPQPAFTLIVTPYYNSHDSGGGLAINMTVSVEAIEGLISAVAKVQANREEREPVNGDP